MQQNVKQIGTAKNFLYQLDRRFMKIDYNQICNRVLILIALIWLFVLSFHVAGLKVQNEPDYQPIPVINLEPIEVE